MMKKHGSCYFLRWQWQLHTRRPIHIGGTIAPCYIRWWERKFQGAKIPGCESSRERKFQGVKVPWSESSKERKFQGVKVPHLELSLPGSNGLGS